MKKLLKMLWCMLAHTNRYEYSEWRAVGFADWERVGYCPKCNTKWKVHR